MTPTETSSSNMTVRCSACGSWNRIRSDKAADGPKCGKCSAAIDLSHPLMLTDETFARTIAESDVPVLVDFYADWCGPCKMMAPHFANAATQLPEVRFAKVDTEACPQAGAAYAIRSIPTLILFRGGKEVARQSGAMAAGELVRWVQARLAGGG